MGLVGGQNSPSVSRFEQGRGGCRKETPSASRFERGRWLDNLRLAFRAREGMVGGCRVVSTWQGGLAMSTYCL